MNRFLLLILLFPACLSQSGLSQTYTTRFEGNEDPLSEGGRWGNQGVDWTDGRGIGSNTNFGFSSFTARGLGMASRAQSNVAGQTPLTGPLRASKNPHYFEDASGRPLILCGSQTWNTLQDWGTGGTVQPLDFDAFVGFLKEHGHNFTLLWRTELPKFSNLPVTASNPPEFTVSPHPWLRTGPGLATDGGLKFDLTKFDPGYFERLRTRVDALNRAGIYAGVYLFTGEWLLRFRSGSDGYPFSAPNNVNGVDDGYRGGPAESGLASVTMTGTNIITELQDAYVRRTIDTLNDLPNVLWIISEEAPMKSTWWNNHLISFTRAYERGKPFQHPIGYATLDGSADSILYNSNADWVAPWAWISPSNSCGTGNPPCKVNINDSDHSYFGMWNDPPQKNRNYAWQNFTAGLLPSGESEPLPLSGQRHRRQTGPALGEFPEQSRLSPAILTQAQPGLCHPQEFSLFDKILPCADPAHRRGVSGLCSWRRRIYRGSFRHVQLATAGGRMV